MASVMTCCRCQSPAQPSSAEYWHIGETAILFDNSSGPQRKAENKADMKSSWTGAFSATPKNLVRRFYSPSASICNTTGLFFVE